MKTPKVLALLLALALAGALPGREDGAAAVSATRGGGAGDDLPLPPPPSQPAAPVPVTPAPAVPAPAAPPPAVQAPPPPVAPPFTQAPPPPCAPTEAGMVRLAIQPQPPLYPGQGPGSPVYVGEAVRYGITSERFGYVLVVDATPDGKVSVIFPNELSRRQDGGAEPQLAAGRTLSIPDPRAGFQFKTEEPAGRGVAIALVLSEKSDAADVAGRLTGLAPLARPDDAERTLTGLLCQPRLRGSWWIGGAPYEIIRPAAPPQATPPRPHAVPPPNAIRNTY